MLPFDVSVANTVRRATTRRTFLARSLRWGVGASTAVGVLAIPATAEAASCSVTTSEYGCQCHASTILCDLNGTPCPNGIPTRPRATWAPVNGGHCWCSPKCYNGSVLGYYTCCDGYTPNGRPCLCSQFH